MEGEEKEQSIDPIISNSDNEIHVETRINCEQVKYILNR